MAKRSRRHHYLPECYLKGFSDDNGLLTLYDKSLDKFSTVGPRQAFVEKDRSGTQWIEHLYGYVEGMAAPLFQKLIKSHSSSVPLSYIEKLQLGLFITTTFWRSPAQDELVDRLTITDKFNGTIFRVVDTRTGNPIDDELLSQIMGDPLASKAYRLAISLIPQIDISRYDMVNNWKFFYQDPGFCIVGDNPVVHWKTPEYKEVLDEFIFPVSSNRFIVYTDRIPPETLSERFSINFGCAMLQQCHRFIASSKPQFLELIVKLYKSERSFWENNHYRDRLLANDGFN